MLHFKILMQCAYLSLTCLDIGSQIFEQRCARFGTSSASNLALRSYDGSRVGIEKENGDDMAKMPLLP